MKVGFTGTRDGMTDAQRFAVADLIRRFHPDEFHHGGCIGADKQAHDTWSMLRAGHRLSKTVVHPADVPRRYRSENLLLYPHDEMREPKPPLDRNHSIVDETDLLIAAPRGLTEVLRSGTWATVRYARKRKRKIYIVTANGESRSDHTQPTQG